MRLINIKNIKKPYFLEFYDGAALPYAILSHTWSDGEVTYQDFCSKYVLNIRMSSDALSRSRMASTNSMVMLGWHEKLGLSMYG